MFTAKKLLELPYKTRLRKLVLILQKAEQELAAGAPVDTANLISLLETIKQQASAAFMLPIAGMNPAPTSALRWINATRHALLQELGAEPAEWDFIVPETGVLDVVRRRVFQAEVFLEDIRSPFNVGAIFRTAESFGAAQIYLSQATPRPDHKKAARTSRGAEQILPWSVNSLQQISVHPAIFALETGGIPVDQYQFPEKGVVLIGSEELGLSPEALKLADRSAGRVGIPLYGAKRSLNVSVAFGILMEHWCRQLNRDLPPEPNQEKAHQSRI